MITQRGPTRFFASSPVVQTVDSSSTPEVAFALICAVDKWPVWLSFLRSVRLAQPQLPLNVGSEVIVRSTIPGEPEQIFEVDRYLQNHLLSLVGAYSVRRRIEFRIERKSTSSRIMLKVDYPAYGGRLGFLVDRFTARRRLDTALGDSLIHFKGLVEYNQQPDVVLADF
ncbi:MAG: hypothetical protein M3160_09150 [Candidatus Eremiobacteraeota bacterium]|nr:hypothetical protein [Candidatus Eremiobacteraeota bacterium]